MSSLLILGRFEAVARWVWNHFPLEQKPCQAPLGNPRESIQHESGPDGPEVLGGRFQRFLQLVSRRREATTCIHQLTRAAALAQLGRKDEARAAAAELLKLEPDFATRGRELISNYVKVDDLVDGIIEGLRKAGLGDLR